MKTILTIDFDIIMAPSIMIYNEYVPGLSFRELKDKCGIYNHCKADMVHYARLTRLLMHAFKTIPKENIHFIHNHDSVVNYVKEKVTLINIDHHHDLSYNQDLERDQLEQLGCANWVRWLYEKDLIENYFWIKNDISIMPEKYFDFRYLELKTLEDLNSFFDKNNVSEIIICFSEPWIPDEYYELFYLWMDLCNEQYKTHFEFEDYKL